MLHLMSHLPCTNCNVKVKFTKARADSYSGLLLKCGKYKAQIILRQLLKWLQRLIKSKPLHNKVPVMTCFHTELGEEDEVGFRKPLLNLVFNRLENKKNCCSLNLTTHSTPVSELNPSSLTAGFSSCLLAPGLDGLILGLTVLVTPSSPQPSFC